MSVDPRPSHSGDPELVPEDDTIIGRALRASLFVLAGLAVAGLAVYFSFFGETAEPEPETEIAPSAPAAVYSKRRPSFTL